MFSFQVEIQVEFVEEFRHPDIKNSFGFSLEFDFYFPKINLAFEFQVEIQVEKYLIF